MPRLVDDAGDLLLVLRVAQHEAVLCRVFAEPLTGWRVCKACIEHLVGRGDDVCCQARLMLTGARDGGFGGSFGICFLFTHPLCHVCLLRAVEQLLLFFNRAVRRAEHQLHSVLFGCLYHLPHGRRCPLVHLIAVLDLFSLDAPVLRQRVFGIGKQQVVFFLLLGKFLRQLLLFCFL